MRRQIRKLPPEEHERARTLYEQTFTEDSRAFTEYYFREKAAGNEILAVESDGEILSMLHLNPYPMHFCGTQTDTSYIVAVATKETYRHQGMMASLLRAALEKLYEEKSPFVWLMPAAEAIYAPFDFRYIYWKNQMFLDGRMPSGQMQVQCRNAKERDLPELAYAAEQILSSAMQVYACRSEQYFLDLKHGVESDGGNLVLFETKNRICGYFLASRQTKEVWEVVIEPHYAHLAPAGIRRWFGDDAGTGISVQAFPQCLEKAGQRCRIPAIMGRIVHLETFVSNLKMEAEKEWFVELEDALLLENNGRFHIAAGPDGGTLKRLFVRRDEKERAQKENRQFQKMQIGELTELLFPEKVYLNELV